VPLLYTVCVAAENEQSYLICPLNEELPTAALKKSSKKTSEIFK